MRRIILTGSILVSSALLSFFAWTAEAQKGGTEAGGETQGSVLFKSYCASCHGTDGRGGGPVAKSMKGPIPDLTLITVHNKGTFPAAHLGKMISGDDVMPGAHGNREMPVWGPVFSRVGSDRDLGRTRIDNLVQYLREIQKP
jgi:mono/diheme cytochrome c family protein